MTNVLLIWNQVQYGIQYYFLEDVEEGDVETLELVNGHYINEVGQEKEVSDALMDVSDMLSSNPEHALNKEIAGKWVGFQVDVTGKEEDLPELPTTPETDLIVECGFIP